MSDKILPINSDTPESQNVSSDSIMHLIDTFEKERLNIYSLLIMKNDVLIAEGYYSPVSKDMLQRCFSITKVITAIAIGLLIDVGKLSKDDKICDYFPEYLPENPHPYLTEMTIHDMLRMRTCHAFSTYNKFDLNSDWVESFFTTEPTHPSNTVFHYDTSGIHVLSALVEKLTGGRMWDFVREKLSILGFTKESYIICDGHDVEQGGSGLMATSRDLLKLAYFIEHRGNVNGVQLLSSSYIEEMCTNMSDTRANFGDPFERGGYGMQIWHNGEDSYCCYGMSGQLIIFYPLKNMIVVTNADTKGMGSGIQLIFDSINNFVENCEISGDSGVNNSDSCDSILGSNENLQEKLNSCEILQEKLNSLELLHEKSFYNGVWVDSSEFNPETEIHRLIFPLNGRNTEFVFKMNNFATGIVPGTKSRYAACGSEYVSGNEHHLYIKACLLGEERGTLHFDVTFLSKDQSLRASNGKHESGIVLFIRKIEESLFSEYDWKHFTLFEGEYVLE